MKGWGGLSRAWARWFGAAPSKPAASKPAGRSGSGGRRPLLPLTEGQQGFARYLVLLAALGLILMLLGTQERRSREGEPDQGTAGLTAAVGPALGDTGDYARRLERAMAETLSRMEGVGRVEVLITLSAGPETLLHEDGTRESRTTMEDDGADLRRETTEERSQTQAVMRRRDGGREEEPVVRMERYPRIRGVLVVAEGAGHAGTRLRITRAVEALLQLPAHRISVEPRG